MKSTKTVLAVAIVIAGIVLFGCGSDVSSGVTLADARAECDSFETLVTGAPLTNSEFNTVIIFAESDRDAGFSQSDFILDFAAICVANTSPTAVTDQCIVCYTTVSAAVWP